MCAAIVGDVDVAAVADFATRHLAPYKRPKEIHIVAMIPRFGLSKVRRAGLAAELGLDIEPNA